ncbi:MAG: IS1 family transposase [Flavobacteriales bacterium]|nr:IS1 family transposase [Flavobacteriales bacterium]
MRAVISCAHCSSNCIRKGTYKGIQLLRCGTCLRYQRVQYRYLARTPGVDERIILYVREGCGIRSIGRILCIAVSTVIARIKRIASRLGPGPIRLGRSYEVDELATYVGNKKNRVWVAYAMDRITKKVVALCTGRRNKRTLQPMMTTLVLAAAKQIRTDALPLYRSLIPQSIHRVKRAGTNGIERMNLNLRTHLKRLARRTICYSKSTAMLAACVMIYCWG